MSMSEEEARREIARLVELHGPGILMDAAGKGPARRKPGPKKGSVRVQVPQEHLEEMADLIVTGAVKGRTHGIEAAASAIVVKYHGMPLPTPLADRGRWRTETMRYVRRFRDQESELLARARERAKPKTIQVPRSSLWGGFDIADLAISDPLNNPRIGTAWERLKAHANRLPDPSTAFGRLSMAAGEFDAAHVSAMQRAREQYENPALLAAQERLEQELSPLRAAQERYENSAAFTMQRQIEEQVERALWGAPGSVIRQEHERWLREQETLNHLDPLRHLRRGGPGSGI